MGESRDGRRIPRVSHPFRILVFVLAVLLVGAGAFALGWTLRTPESVALDAADDSIPVFGDVELRTVSETVTFQGTAQSPEKVSVVPPAPDGTTRAVATAVAVEAGQSIASGTWLGSVSGRPVFALSMSLEPYRDLHKRDSGPDVTSLQEALTAAGFATQSTGVFDSATQASLKRLYSRSSLAGPGGTSLYFAASEFVRLASSEAKVLSVAAVGAVVTPDAPLVTMQAGASVVSARVTVLDARSLEVGTVLSVSASTFEVDGVVVGISDFRAADASHGAAFDGMDVTVELPADAAVAGQVPVTVSAPVESPETLAVPAIAIRQDGAAQYVLVKDAGTDSGLARVDVVVIRQSGGWVALKDQSTLSVGQKVLLSDG